MIIKQINLTNFRSFEQLELALDPRLNVFVGGNGSGKTTILQAISLALSPVLISLPIDSPGLQFGENLPEFRLADIRIVEEDRAARSAKITADARFEDDQSISWTIERLFSSRNNTLRQDREAFNKLVNYCTTLVQRHNSGRDYLLPIFAVYGTDRSVSDADKKSFDEVLPQFFRRLAGMKDALSPVADFQRAVGWFDLLERRDLRDRRDSGGLSRGSSAYDAVRLAIEQMIDGIYDPRIDGTTGRFVVDQPTRQGKRVKLFLDQLSDGYQVLLGVVMDFAIRLALASPPGLSPREVLGSEAILVIDEIDLHLHPAWQQQVVPRLRQTFPNTQIILTTHSPQVLSTVDKKYIRPIVRDGVSKTTNPPPLQTLGVESAAVMAAVQNVDPIPKVEESELVNRYRRMIAEGTHDTDEGRADRRRLDAHFESTHHVMLDLDRIIRFEEFKRRAASRKS